MINALGQPQTLLLLGGTSDIALAIARDWARNGSPARGRSPPGPGRVATPPSPSSTGLGLTVEAVDFEAEATDTPRRR